MALLSPAPTPGTPVNLVPRSAAPRSAEPAAEAARRSAAGPLLLWLSLQLAALAVALFRLPLSARYPGSPERLAIDILATVEVVAAPLLGPLLFRDWACSALCIASIAPMLAIAGTSSAVQPGPLFQGIAYLMGLLAGLALLTGGFRQTRGVWIVAAGGAAIALGEPLMRYLIAEYGSAPQSVTLDTEWAGPLQAASCAFHGCSVPLASWTFPIGLLVAGAIVVAVRRRFSSRGAQDGLR